MILWSINVYSRFTDARILARQVREHFGERVYVLVVCSNESESLDQLKTQDVDTVIGIPNSGHHNGVRDALNVTAGWLLGARPFEAVVCSHADNLWSCLEPVELALQKLRAPGQRDMGTVSETTYDAVAISGGPRGAMDSDNPDWFGYFMDWIAFTPECLLSICPITRECDGARWIECVVADVLRDSQSSVYELPCESVDRLGTNMFIEIMGNADWWMSADHDLDRKLRLLPSDIAWKIRQEHGL
jgi:hypothetical protein